MCVRIILLNTGLLSNDASEDTIIMMMVGLAIQEPGYKDCKAALCAGASIL